MEDAVESFLNGSSEMHRKLQTVLRRHTSPRGPDYQLRHFCRQLVSQNPLRLDTSVHGAFWDVYLQVSMGMENPYGNFRIDVNNNERLLRTDHADALLCILVTLLSDTFTQRLTSCRGLPQHILIAFLRQDGFRALLMDRVLMSCEDRINLHELRATNAIGVELYDDLMDSVFVDRFDSPYDTPEPELEWHADAQMDADVPLPELPTRRPSNSFTLEFPHERVAELATLYQRLSAGVAQVRDRVETELRERHGAQCRCVHHVYDTRALYSLAHALVTQSVDAKTLGKPQFQALLNTAPSLWEAVIPTVDTYRRYRVNVTFEEQFTREVLARQMVTDRMITSVRARYSKGHSTIVSIGCCAVAVLLAELEAQYLSVYQGAKLRAFFAGRSRDQFVAFSFSKDISCYALLTALEALRSEFGATWPELFDYCVVSNQISTYCVIRPVHMSCLRLLACITADAKTASIMLPAIVRAAFKPVRCTDGTYMDVAYYCLMRGLEALLRKRLGRTAVEPPKHGTGALGLQSLRNLLVVLRGVPLDDYEHILRTYVLRSQVVLITSQACKLLLPRVDEEAEFFQRARVRLRKANTSQASAFTLHSRADCARVQRANIDEFYATLCDKHADGKSVIEILRGVSVRNTANSVPLKRCASFGGRAWTALKSAPTVDVTPETRRHIDALHSECGAILEQLDETRVCAELQDALAHGTLQRGYAAVDWRNGLQHTDILSLLQLVEHIQLHHYTESAFNPFSLSDDIMNAEFSLLQLSGIDLRLNFEFSFVLPFEAHRTAAWSRTDGMAVHTDDTMLESSEAVLDTLCQFPQEWAVSESVASSTREYVDILRKLRTS